MVVAVAGRRTGRAQELSVRIEVPHAENLESKGCGRVLLPLGAGFQAGHANLEWEYHDAVTHITMPRGHLPVLYAIFRCTFGGAARLWFCHCAR